MQVDPHYSTLRNIQDEQKTQRIFREVKILHLVLKWWIEVIMYLSKPTEGTATWVSTQVNYGLGVMTCQCRFIVGKIVPFYWVMMTMGAACLYLPLICAFHHLLPHLGAHVSQCRSDTITMPQWPLQSHFPWNPKPFITPCSLPVKVQTL